ncbi:putative mucin-like glycoprotein [Trypanosoma conorhini]|uniref:Putative mucin-like glycoprotein n=1 Tax=Trypanosoma conorhini TaxID=83891 RepID=A0A3S5ISR7_9TRYP|nr:putative mucin-like glycoprotein [Trypanosoma conorhini]RNF12954.1 putative mucin-like glycoprotein [Trypanosoma conorhini]
MATRVRRRAACALALLALLCGCCCPSFVCGAAKPPAAPATARRKHPPEPLPEFLRKGWQGVNVSVEVSCADSGNKLSWRFSSTAAWTKCAAAVGGLDYTILGEDSAAEEVEDVVTIDVVSVGASPHGAGDGGVSEPLCLSAESLYATANCKASCGSDKDGQTAFTMNFPTHAGSGVHKKWEEAKTNLRQSVSSCRSRGRTWQARRLPVNNPRGRPSWKGWRCA